MFEVNATELIRGLRKHKYNPEYIQKMLHQVQIEIVEPGTRKQALQKLIIFHLLGKDISWAGFHVIQGMSQPGLEKRIAYTVSPLVFMKRPVPVLIMATNIIKKDLQSNSVNETLYALGSLAEIVTPELARDVGSDIINLLRHSNANVRKRSLIVLKRMIMVHSPLFDSFPRIAECLEDQDKSVVSCCVTIICEMGKLDAQKYLQLAPQLFELFCESKFSNWMRIKLVKLWATLTPHEPRLARKLLGPMQQVIINSTAISVVYECVHAVIVGNMIQDNRESEQMTVLIIKKVKEFLANADQNIRFLGLLTLSRFAMNHPEIVAEHHEVILSCLDDEDSSIRLAALELVQTLISEATLFDIIRKLMIHLARTPDNEPTEEIKSYQESVAITIMNSCNQKQYGFIPNFEWYLQVLSEIANIASQRSLGENVCLMIRDSLIDISVRVEEVRPVAVNICFKLMLDLQNDGTNLVLEGAAWVVGEYSNDPNMYLEIIERSLNEKTRTMSPSIRSIYLYVFLKVLSRGITNSQSFDFTAIQQKLDTFIAATELEVQERALFIKEIVIDCEKSQKEGNNPWQEQYKEAKWIGKNLASLFTDVVPVSATAQQRVAIPEGLDLDTWLVPFENEDFLSSPISPLKVVDDLEIGIEKLKIEEPIVVDDNSIRKQNLISVASKPIVKKYELKLNHEGDDLVPLPLANTNNILETNLEPTSSKKKPKREADSVRVNRKRYSVWTRGNLSLSCTFGEQPPDFGNLLECQLELTLYLSEADKVLKFEFQTEDGVVKLKGTKCRLKTLIQRATIDTYFSKKIQGTLMLAEPQFISFNLPFEINMLLPSQRLVAQMTPPKFISLLQDGYFSAVGSTSVTIPPNQTMDGISDSIAKEICCIVVERFAGVVSIYGMVVNGITIVGLIKEQRNSNGRRLLLLDLKCGDGKVLEWAVEKIAQFGNELL